VSGELPDPRRISGDDLRAYVLQRRWFGSKSREVASLEILAAPWARTLPPLLAIALVETRFETGTHEVYQVPLGFRSLEEGWSEGVVCELDGWTGYDAAADPALARELVSLMREGQTLSTEDGRLEFRSVEGGGLGFEMLDVVQARPVGAEQSNTSIVLDDSHVLKLYRRLEAGINPELEVLRFLTERGFKQIASLEGWSAYVGWPLDATLSILQQYVHSEGDGWELVLAALQSDDGDAFLPRLRRLGEVTADLHNVLASDPHDANFSPEEPSVEALALLSASIDEEIALLFLSLPEGVEALDPIRGRGEEVRERLRLMSSAANVGKIIRTHGDYHLGQVLWADDWVILDFEGEPARSLPERRRKQSPLRDVAGMLRSFAYAASAAGSERDWEERARREFLDAYLEVIDRRLIPSGDALERVLAIFELEKAVYELRYELDNRPDWVHIPVTGIQRLLEEVPA
jgi:trehalose synthase-fused probable maltokinase